MKFFWILNIFYLVDMDSFLFCWFIKLAITCHKIRISSTCLAMGIWFALVYSHNDDDLILCEAFENIRAHFYFSKVYTSALIKSKCAQVNLITFRPCGVAHMQSTLMGDRRLKNHINRKKNNNNMNVIRQSF